MMSRSYTSAKRAHLDVKPDFDLDGVEFVCEGGISTLDISEFAVAAKSGMDTEDPMAAAVFAEFFQAALGPAQYRRFKDHIRRHGTDGDVLVDIMQGLMEDFVGRPTEEPSHSQDGPSTTGPTSRVVSLQRGSVTQDPAEPGQKARQAVAVSYG
jgi:hypothetical protein